jgi:pimeloyl-ACP methyl ester carboxylesterase
MQSVEVNDIQLECELIGSGEPVLLVSPVLADGFLPLVSEPALTDYQLIRYHRRGWAGSTHTAPPVSIGDHAGDAAALLEQLGVQRAHIVGHSSGAAVAAQMALERPELTHTLTLLELSLFSVPGGTAFLEGAAPVLDVYASGDHSGALAMFLSSVSGLDWPECRALLEERCPGTIDQTIADADTFFTVELPALTQWSFDARQAASIDRPVLSVIGADTGPLWVEVADFLRASLPRLEDLVVDGVGHLLHIQSPEPVARGIARFLARNPIAGEDFRLPTPTAMALSRD